MYYLKISRAHQELATLEIEELFNNFQLTWIEENLAAVTGSKDEIVMRVRRSGSVRLVFELTMTSERRDMPSVLNLVRELDISRLRGRTFRARVYKVDAEGVDWRSVPMERAVGSVILGRDSDIRVDLKSPDEVVVVVVWGQGVGVGFLTYEHPVSEITWRAPKNLPHFRGGAMKQTICRHLVNLHTESEGSYVVDPFCGHGGLLYEIYEVGYNPIGIEIDRKIIDQALVNLEFTGYQDVITFINGDALRRPFRRGAVGYYVTDPPYAIQTTTSGRTVEEITRQWLETYHEPTVAVVVTPNETLKELPDNWKVLKRANDYVHKNLVRRVRVISHG